MSGLIGAHGVVVEPQPLGRTGPQVVVHDVGAPQQRFGDRRRARDP